MADEAKKFRSENHVPPDGARVSHLQNDPTTRPREDVNVSSIEPIVVVRLRRLSAEIMMMTYEVF